MGRPIIDPGGDGGGGGGTPTPITPLGGGFVIDRLEVLPGTGISIDFNAEQPRATISAVAASYAQIYVAGGVAAQTTNGTPGTYDVLTGLATDGLASGCTADVANDQILCSPAGVYEVTFSASFSGTLSETFEVELYNSTTATAYTYLHFERKMGTGGDIVAASFTGLVSVADGDALKVRIACPSGASKSFTLKDGNLTVALIARS